MSDDSSWRSVFNLHLVGGVGVLVRTLTLLSTLEENCSSSHFTDSSVRVFTCGTIRFLSSFSAIEILLTAACFTLIFRVFDIFSWCCLKMGSYFIFLTIKPDEGSGCEYQSLNLRLMGSLWNGQRPYFSSYFGMGLLLTALFDLNLVSSLAIKSAGSSCQS